MLSKFHQDPTSPASVLTTPKFQPPAHTSYHTMISFDSSQATVYPTCSNRVSLIITEIIVQTITFQLCKFHQDPTSPTLLLTLPHPPRSLKNKLYSGEGSPTPSSETFMLFYLSPHLCTIRTPTSWGEAPKHGASPCSCRRPSGGPDRG